MYQLKITLNDISPEIWRRILVSENISLYKFHHIIQIVTGWSNSHLYFFGDIDNKIGDIHLWNDNETQPDNVIKVKDVLNMKNPKLSYVYDIGDNWEHTIQLEEVHKGMKTQRKCIAGERRCPPEDCGGVIGYERILTILKNPALSEYQEMKEWLGDGFDPDHIDVPLINAGLSLLSEFIREYEEGE